MESITANVHTGPFQGSNLLQILFKALSALTIYNPLKLSILVATRLATSFSS